MRYNKLHKSTAIALSTVLLAGCGVPGVSGNDEDIFCKVNGIEITKDEYNKFLKQSQALYKGQSVSKDQKDALKDSVKESLIQQALLRSAAEDAGIKVSDKDVDARIDQIQEQLGKDNFAKELKKQGLTEDGLRDNIRNQLLTEAYYKKTTDGIKVSDKEIEQYYKDNKSRFTAQDQRKVAHILVKDKKTAEGLYNQLQGGADFAKLAKANSQDPGTKANGGVLVVTKGQMVPEFEKAAFAGETNNVSQPVKTPFGWHLIKPLENTKKSAGKTLKEAKAEIEQSLKAQKQSQAVAKKLEAERKDADISCEKKED
jgi:foldase protein PrsA